MKKLISIFLIAAVAVVGFSSCSSDDDDNSLAAAVAGTYVCSIDVSAISDPEEEGVEVPMLPATVVIKKATDTTVDFELKGFKFTDGGDEIPLVLEGVSVTGEKDNAKVSSTEQSISFKLAEIPVTAQVKILGTSFIKSKSDFNFDVMVKSTAGIPNGATIVVMPVVR